MLRGKKQANLSLSGNWLPILSHEFCVSGRADWANEFPESVDPYLIGLLDPNP